MKLVIVVAALCICATSASRFVLPRVPLSVLLRGNVPLIDLDNRIVGGVVVEPNSLPFQVSMQRKVDNAQYCGGSILSATKVLCAAHCVRGINEANYRIVAGEHDLTKVSGLEQIRDISAFVAHPNYSSNTYDNDVSIITVSEPFDLSVPSAQPVNLPTAEQCAAALLDGFVFTVSGWGTIRSGGAISEELRKVDVPAVNETQCKKDYPGQITPSMICAGEKGKDSCQGDSGGPLFKKVSNAFVQHGVVSWGYGCAVADKPGVYASVCNLIDWIKGAAGLP